MKNHLFSSDNNTVTSITLLLITGMGIGFLTGLSASPVVSIVISGLFAAISIIPSVVASFTDNLFAYLRFRLEVEHGVKDSSSALNANNASPNFSIERLAPAAILVLGVAAGSMLGIYARNKNFLGPTIVEQRLESLGIPVDAAERSALHGYLDNEIEYWSTQRSATSAETEPMRASIADDLFEIYFSQVLSTDALPGAAASQTSVPPSANYPRSVLYESDAGDTCSSARQFRKDPVYLEAVAQQLRSNTNLLEQVFDIGSNQAYSNDLVLAGAILYLCSDK